MFKRVDKRRRKKEEEEKLGLDEEVKEILGIQDTDSEESESDSDDGEGEESVAEEEEEEEEEMNSNEEDEEDDREEDPITVSQALKDPLYNVSVLPDIKACIVCPGKLLKSVKMVQLHRTSNAHIRRFSRFSDNSVDAKPSDNAWDILKRNSVAKPKLSLTTTGVSKRAEKKKKASQARKARREGAKVKAKAKKAKAASESASPDCNTHGLLKAKSPLKKKRKIDTGQVLSSVKISTPSTPPLPTKKREKKQSANTKPAPVAAGALEDASDDNAHRPPNIQDSVKIQDIVKSASNRAKTARSRALSMSKKRKSSD